MLKQFHGRVLLTLLTLFFLSQLPVFAKQEPPGSCHNTPHISLPATKSGSGQTRLPRKHSAACQSPASTDPPAFPYTSQGFSRRWLTHFMYPTFCRMVLCNSNCLTSYLLDKKWEDAGLSTGLTPFETVPCTVDKTPVFADNQNSACCNMAE